MTKTIKEEGITIRQTNILPKKDRYRTIWYSQDDYATIMALSIQQRKPMVHVAHDLITAYLVCQKQDHSKVIDRLKQERAILGAELTLYRDHFGKLPESARPEKNLKGSG